MENKKAITFSYDDGTLQDIRLVEIFNKYNLKCTFNLNSQLFGLKNELSRDHGIHIRHDKVNAADVKHIYDGHEVAVHTLTHPNLVALGDDDIVREVEQDRIALSELCGYEVVGMAYPGGTADERVAGVLRDRTGVKYSRTVKSTFDFAPQENLYLFNPTIHHHADWNRMYETADRFFASQSEHMQVLYIWGHAFEFDVYPERWAQFEEFCRYISSRPDISYCTNSQALL